MNAIEGFLGAVKPDTKEERLAQAYRDAQSAFESKQAGLLKCLRAEKTSKGLVPVFSPEAENIATALQEAENRVAEVQADIEKFLELTGGEASLTSLGIGLADKFARARRTLDNVVKETNAIRERAVRTNPGMTPLEAEQLEVVQQAFDKRDRIQAELGPVIADFEGKLAEVNKIMKKYA
jgi:cell fate (sporulation/competence/biofilm development) regulator YmcA (YheA/YmcA/DUF963 family)